MVYNTTGTSLNITDLTTDDEYLVTVSGKDGAGQFGDTSEVLSIDFSCT